VNGLLFRGVGVAALVAAVAVPAASAKSGARVRLSILPLPRSVIGRAAKSLPLQPDSGFAPNKHAAKRGAVLIPTHSRGGGKGGWAHLGRIGGYALDYGLGASGGAGVTNVYTNVDQYKTSSDAERGLFTWQSYDQLPFGLGQSGGAGLSGTIKIPKVAPVGSNRFAVLVSYSAANIAPVFGLDEQFTEGRYEADVTVWAGSAAAATRLAQSLARKLYTRIKLAREGRLHAKPVKLPPQPPSGPLPGGPDLAALAFRPSDIPSIYGSASGSCCGVSALDPTALSGYYLTTCWDPKGCATFLDQDIEWCPSANQASFMADLWSAFELHYEFSPLDLSGVGDGAQGFLQQGSDDGAIVLSSGQLMEFIQVYPVQAPDLQSFAQTAANYINAAGLGS